MNIKPQGPKDNDDNGQISNGLLVGDMLRYLSRLADMQRDARTGNPSVGDGLRRLVKALQPHRARTVEDLPALLSSIGSSRSLKPRPKKTQVPLPENLAALECDEVERVLGDEKYLKSQIVELGASRFSISRSKLTKLPKPDAIASIRAALDHERSLAAISNQAHIAGQRRTV